MSASGYSLPASRLATRRLIVAAFSACLVFACGGETPAPKTKDPETIAKELVAEFLQVPIGDIALVSLEAQEFSDSSLGCPEPGMSYLQALTPGHQVIVEADGRRFDVRVSSGYGRICRRKNAADRRDKSAYESAAGTSVSTLVDRARDNLARHLDTDRESIVLVDVRPFDASALAPGCSRDCNDDSGVCGYLISLQHDGRRYEYHVDDESVAACPPLLTSRIATFLRPAALLASPAAGEPVPAFAEHT